VGKCTRQDGVEEMKNGRDGKRSFVRDGINEENLVNGRCTYGSN
jgi:hypothetical protein